MPEKQLELSRKNAFFSDPFFNDLKGGVSSDLERRLAEISARSMGLAGSGRVEAAHNIQVSASNDKFQIQLELPGFAPEDFSLKTKDDIVIVEAVHETNEDGSTDSRKFTREFKMPAGVVREQLSSTYSGKGILTVSAPRVLSAPEGAQISEAMKAQSQAYVTDDGTAVKKDEKASSQSIAATTESPDGSTISSFKSSSSSSSSSTMMSSGSGGAMPDMQMPGGMMSMMGGGGMPSLDMDGMMSKMMGDMKMGSGMLDMKSSTGMSSKTSFSSSSSSSFSSSSKMSSDMSSMMGGMPPMRGMEMPGLSFEEMPSMPPTASTAGGKPEYTVTSPPMSPPPPEEMNHKVEQTEDYVPPTTQTAEATVLLKVKDGNEYKLALNMQQFTPEDITIKLNGNELTIEAANGGESFKQKHMIPENIDLDAMSSSFSSDGVLVIKAPKK